MWGEVKGVFQIDNGGRAEWGVGNGLWCYDFRDAPTAADGYLGASISSTTYFCDPIWTNNSGIIFPGFGGDTGDGDVCGFFAIWILDSSNYAYWDAGASIFVPHQQHTSVMHVG